MIRELLTVVLAAILIVTGTGFGASGYSAEAREALPGEDYKNTSF